MCSCAKAGSPGSSAKDFKSFLEARGPGSVTIRQVSRGQVYLSPGVSSAVRERIPRRVVESRAADPANFSLSPRFDDARSGGPVEGNSILRATSPRGGVGCLWGTPVLRASGRCLRKRSMMTVWEQRLQHTGAAGAHSTGCASRRRGARITGRNSKRFARPWW
jgi:hypothetical protein